MAAPSNKSRFRRICLALLVFISAILILVIEPHTLCFVIKHSLLIRAGRHGGHLSIGKVEGSIFEPIVFRDVNFTSSRAGATFHLGVTRAEMRFAWKTLIFHRGNGFFDRLTLDGVLGNVDFESDAEAGVPSPVGPHPTVEQRRILNSLWLPIPTSTDVWRANVALRFGGSNDHALLFSNIHFTVSETAPGELTIGRAAIRQSSFKKIFTGLRGTTALQGTRLVVADLKLDPKTWIKSISTDLYDAAHGQLRIDFDLAAFEGAIRGQLLNTSREKHSNLEVAGTFWQISVASLADFLEVHETTGGIIKEGKFSFRGSPQALDKATISTRFEATDFVWGKRQWNSLILGATIVDRRLEIPELELQQAHNALKLKGKVTLPAGDTPWWESEFNFDIAGRINNLTELSALLGPQFSDAGGVVTIDGSIRGENKIFSGQLIVGGTKLSYRGTPIDLLNAGIKLDGNEVQVMNLELVHGDDFVRGKGGINIFGERRYWGEFKAAIGDLADYRALLQKPIAPAPLAGGLVVDWSGDGTQDAHSGAFTAHCHKLRTTGSPEVPATLPIDADLSGTYAPGGFFLSKCSLANGDTKLDTRVAADNTSLKLDELKLTQKDALWLEGNAVLPVNIFLWWVQPGVAALLPDAPIKVRGTAHGVQLDDVAHLTGRPIPVSGIVSGSLNTDGTLHDLKMTGTVKLTKGKIPENPWLPVLDNVEADAELDGNILRFSKFAAHHSIGDFVCSGAVDFSKFDTPALDLTVHGENIQFSAGPAWSGNSNLDLTVTGTRERAAVSGNAQVTSIDTCPVPDFGPLVSTGSSESINVPAPTLSLPSPLDAWHYDVNVTTAAPLRLPAPTKVSRGQVSSKLQIDGTGTTLTATGNVDFTDLPVKTEFAAGNVEAASFFFTDPKNTMLVARVSGRVSDTSFIGYFAGPVDHPASVFISQPEMSESALRTLLSQGYVPLPPEAGDLNVDLGPLATPAVEPGAQPTPAAPPVAEPSPSVAPTPVESATATPPLPAASATPSPPAKTTP